MQVQVALGADTEVAVDVLRQVLLQGPFNDRLDRCHAGTARDGDDRSAMRLPQMGGAEGTLDPHAVAQLEPFGDMPAGGAAHGAADVKLQDRVAWHIGHRIVARRAAVEGNGGELAGREVERTARRDFEPDPLDVVRRVVDARHPTGEQTARMDDEVVLLEPGHLASVPGNGTAGEDQAARPLLVGQGELGIALHRHLALDEVGLAGAAVSGLAAEWVGDARVQRGFQNGGPRWHVDGAIGLDDADFERH